MKLKQVGDQSCVRVKYKVCGACDCIIEDTGLCSYECPHDGSLARPAGMTIIRVYERLETLISQDIR